MRQALRLLRADGSWDVMIYRIEWRHGALRWQYVTTYSSDTQHSEARRAITRLEKERPHHLVCVPGIRGNAPATLTQLQRLCGFDPGTPMEIIHDYLIEQRVLA